MERIWHLNGLKKSAGENINTSSTSPVLTSTKKIRPLADHPAPCSSFIPPTLLPPVSLDDASMIPGDTKSQASADSINRFYCHAINTAGRIAERPIIIAGQRVWCILRLIGIVTSNIQSGQPSGLPLLTGRGRQIQERKLGCVREK